MSVAHTSRLSFSTLGYPLALLVASLALALCGTLLQPLASLSLFWPVNAILLGLLLRNSRFGTPLAWAGIYLGLVGADRLAGSEWPSSLWLSACNLLQIAAGWLLLNAAPRAYLQLERPLAVLYLWVVCGVSAGLGATGALLYASPWFGSSAVDAWLAWFSEQFSTSLLVLPLILCAPRTWPWRWHALSDALPMLMLVTSTAFGLWLGGAGAMVIPIPALVWCAMRYQLFTTACLGALVGGLAIIRFALYALQSPVLGTMLDQWLSVRLGVAMLVISPLIVASAVSVNRRLLSYLNYRARHKYASGTLTRRAFTKRSAKLLERRSGQAQSAPASLLMMDIDNFQSINDSHGHATGEAILKGFARQISQHLRPGELFGQLGGEAFVLLLPGVDAEDAQLIAKRLQRNVAHVEFRGSLGQPVRITVSMGLACLDGSGPELPLDQLLETARQALIQAKAQGSNRVSLE
jgi:diguanylate cyclase (GGDEF)-like protein